MDILPDDIINQINNYAKPYSEYINELQQELPILTDSDCISLGNKLFDYIIKNHMQSLSQQNYPKAYKFNMLADTIPNQLHEYVRKKFKNIGYDYTFIHDIYTPRLYTTIHISKDKQHLGRCCPISQTNEFKHIVDALYIKIVNFIKYYSAKYKYMKHTYYHYTFMYDPHSCDYGQKPFCYLQQIYDYIKDKLIKEGFVVKFADDLSDIVYPTHYCKSYQQEEFECIRFDHKFYRYLVFYIDWSAIN